MGQSSPGCFYCCFPSSTSSSSETINMPVTGLLVCALLTASYVGSLYISPALATKFGLASSHTEVWWRILGTFVSSLCSLLVARICLGIVPPPKPNCLTTAQILGVSFFVDSVWWDFFLPILITCLLLLPLMVSDALVDVFIEFSDGKVSSWEGISWYFGKHLPEIFFGSIKDFARLEPNIFHSSLIGPLAEELCFRSSMITILRIFGGWSIWPSNIIQSLFFAVAHAHRAIRSSLSGNHSALPATLIQCSFTLIFGMYSGHLLIRSRSVWTCFVAHVICNLVGFPDMGLVLRLPGPLLLILGCISGLCTATGIFLLRLL